MFRRVMLSLAGLFVLLVLARTSAAQHGYFFLVRFDSVQEELGLGGEKLENVLEIAAKYRDEYAALLRKTRNERFDDVGSPGERRKLAPTRITGVLDASKEGRHELTREHFGHLKAVLNEEQVSRLRGIALQHRPGGLGMLLPHHPDIADLLGLSEGQLEQIWATQTAAMQAAKNPAAFARGMDERDKKVLERLTEDQRKKLKELEGEPFDVDQLRQERPGRTSGCDAA